MRRVDASRNCVNVSRREGWLYHPTCSTRSSHSLLIMTVPPLRNLDGFDDGIGKREAMFFHPLFTSTGRQRFVVELVCCLVQTTMWSKNSPRWFLITAPTDSQVLV